MHKRQFNDVKMWITNGRLCGNAMIGYLKQKGFPEVALHFVEDGPGPARSVAFSCSWCVTRPAGRQSPCERYGERILHESGQMCPQWEPPA